jgi:hypothetical protein
MNLSDNIIDNISESESFQPLSFPRNPEMYVICLSQFLTSKSVDVVQHVFCRTFEYSVFVRQVQRDNRIMMYYQITEYCAFRKYSYPLTYFTCDSPPGFGLM